MTVAGRLQLQNATLVLQPGSYTPQYVTTRSIVNASSWAPTDNFFYLPNQVRLSSLLPQR